MAPVSSGEDRQIARHLLGLLPEAEEAALALRRKEDPAFDELCQAVEAELIDDFLQGRLSPEEAIRFERKYLATPESRDKFEFARAMLGSFAIKPPRAAKSRRRLFPALVAVAAAALLAAAGLVFLVNWQPEAVVSYALFPGTARGLEPPQTVRLASSSLALKLSLRTDSDTPADRAVLTPLVRTRPSGCSRLLARPARTSKCWFPPPSSKMATIS
jgi:hypothetical protein